MLEDYHVKPSTIDRVRSSWLAPQIESYLEWLQAHGYSRLVLYRRLQLLSHFAEFAQKKGCIDTARVRPRDGLSERILDRRGIVIESVLSNPLTREGELT